MDNDGNYKNKNSNNFRFQNSNDNSSYNTNYNHYSDPRDCYPIYFDSNFNTLETYTKNRWIKKELEQSNNKNFKENRNFKYDENLDLFEILLSFDFYKFHDKVDRLNIEFYSVSEYKSRWMNNYLYEIKEVINCNLEEPFKISEVNSLIVDSNYSKDFNKYFIDFKNEKNNQVFNNDLLLFSNDYNALKNIKSISDIFFKSNKYDFLFGITIFDESTTKIILNINEFENFLKKFYDSDYPLVSIENNNGKLNEKDIKPENIELCLKESYECEKSDNNLVKKEVYQFIHDYGFSNDYDLNTFNFLLKQSINDNDNDENTNKTNKITFKKDIIKKEVGELTVKSENKEFKSKSNSNIYFSNNNKLYYRNVTNLSTAMREYESIQKVKENFIFLNYEYMCKNLNRVKIMEKFKSCSMSNETNERIYNQISKNMNLNNSQSELIQFFNRSFNTECTVYSEFDKDHNKLKYNKKSFMLIQGPPGTGKTQTILAIILNILIKNPNSNILVCAPSNNATDETATRIYTYLSENGSKFISFKQNDLIRFYTNEKVIYQDTYEFSQDKKILEKISLESQVNEALNNTISTSFDIKISSEKKRAIYDLELRLSVCPNHEKPNLLSMLNNIKSGYSCKNTFNGFKGKKHEIEIKLINQSKIICTTLSGAGHQKLLKKKFDFVLIDESSQAIEPSCLIAIDKADTIIMFGDEMQLPPTVINNKNQLSNFNISLFERIIKVHNYYSKEANLNKSIINNKSTNLFLKDVIFFLDHQYRMDDLISTFISDTFYSGRIMNCTEKLIIDKSNCYLSEKHIIYSINDFINRNIKSNFCFLNYNNKVDKIENSEHDCKYKMYLNEEKCDSKIFQNSSEKENENGNLQDLELDKNEKIEKYNFNLNEKSNKDEICCFLNLKKCLDSTFKNENCNQHEKQNCFSFSNDTEIKIIVEIVKFVIKIISNSYEFQLKQQIDSVIINVSEYDYNDLLKMYVKKKLKINYKIGVVSFYKEQANLIKKELSKLNLIKCYVNEITRVEIDVNTVDSFQGKEKEIIILSSVRSNDAGVIGFLNELKRLNVSISRAKKFCFIVGDLITISKSNNIYWIKLLNYLLHKESLFTLYDIFNHKSKSKTNNSIKNLTLIEDDEDDNENLIKKQKKISEGIYINSNIEEICKEFLNKIFLK